MFRRFCVIGTLVLTCLGLGACSTPVAKTAPPKAEIGATEEDMIRFAGQWVEAFNAHDAERLAALYSETAYVIAGQDAYPPKPYFKLMEGRSSLHAERLEFGWYLFDKNIGFMDHKIEITETIDGTPKSRTLDVVMALRYRNGQWQIYGHHLSEPL
ncbi:MAG: hypothetical protein JO006_15115 [Paucibacter sp.]|nr:hypothetical protein [Roseateles sp.]